MKKKRTVKNNAIQMPKLRRKNRHTRRKNNRLPQLRIQNTLKNTRPRGKRNNRTLKQKEKKMIQMMHTLNLKLTFQKPFAQHLKQTILPELNDTHQKRSTANITAKKNKLTLKINATDKTALKASLNSYLKQVKMFIQTWEEI
jgi:tRNA threonylcarbamoyladenosine modification (KEOPS) complex  Pcc1 subunit